jgi:hypothetical protein
LQLIELTLLRNAHSFGFGISCVVPRNTHP